MSRLPFLFSNQADLDDEGFTIADEHGEPITIQVRRHVQAKRVNLRIDPKAGGAILTAPPKFAERRLRAFVQQNRIWLMQALDRLPPALPFEDGKKIPIEGRMVRITWRKEHRGPCQLEKGLFQQKDEEWLLVGGDAPFLKRRVRDFLKTLARARISALATEKAERIGKRYRRIVIRDQATRWGSCAISGDLSFNWRLICAEPSILDYVVAHEVAHLRHRNHAEAFWHLAESLTDGDMQRARDWLHEEGARLLRIGL